MALDDTTKDALGWALLVPGFLHMIGDLTGEKGFSDAGDSLIAWCRSPILSSAGALRTDHVDIGDGSMEIGEGVEVEVVEG